MDALQLGDFVGGLIGGLLGSSGAVLGLMRRIARAERAAHEREHHPEIAQPEVAHG